MKLKELGALLPDLPTGHVDNNVKQELCAFEHHMADTTENLARLTALVARANYLIKHPPKPSGGTFPTGDGAPMKVAA